MENNRKDPRRQLIGAVSKALGQQFERDINAAFDHYRRLGVASIEKTPEPFHMTGRENGGKVVGFYEKKPSPTMPAHSAAAGPSTWRPSSPDRTAWSNPASAPARPSIWTKRCGSVLSAMFWPDFLTAVRTASHGASGAP